MRAEENEYLTRVGPGTPMGTLLRRYWMPVLLEHEVPGANQPPVRVRVANSPESQREQFKIAWTRPAATPDGTPETIAPAIDAFTNVY